MRTITRTVFSYKVTMPKKQWKWIKRREKRYKRAKLRAMQSFRRGNGYYIFSIVGSSVGVDLHSPTILAPIIRPILGRAAIKYTPFSELKDISKELDNDVDDVDV